MKESQKTKLSVIIPFRCETESSYYLMSRLEDLILTFPNELPIEFIVVDSGSKPEYQKKCSEICLDNNIRYLYQDTFGKPFSIGLCRDFGVQYALGDAVSFLDVDLRVSSDFWSRLLLLMEAWGISYYKKSFFSIPCLYLTQEGTEEFLNQKNGELKFLDYYLRYLQGDKFAIENIAFCSSVMVVDRNHYLSVGGHDLGFRGHGYEDFELYHRLLCEESIIPKSDDYYLDQKTWKTATYKGFRSHLAIIGRPAMMMSLFVIHLWHPRPKDMSFYSAERLKANRNIWQDKFREFEKNRVNPKPLVNKSITQDSLLFFAKSFKSPSSASLRDVFPHLGNVIYANEHNFIDEEGKLNEEDFRTMLNTSNISKVVFPNPYGNRARLEIYQWCLRSGFPYYCYDRGALPDSWFLDSKGFNADSGSYSPNLWDKKLNDEQESEINNYIHSCIYGDSFLEYQSNRIGYEALADKLQTGSKKVLFIPLQRPSDTVIKYMCGEVQTYYRFIKLIDKLAQRLISLGWVVLCKEHPLEKESPHLNYAQYVPRDTHFIDLLELADRVALINSGVGIYSMMMSKPCYIFGDAFYAIEGINKSIEFLDIEDSVDINNLAKDIINGFEVDKNKVNRFIHYLVEEFYSFGSPRTINYKESDGSMRTITTGIDFYDLKIDGVKIFQYEKKKRPQLDLSAPLFERYALDIHMKKKRNSSVKASVESKAIETRKKHAIVKSSDSTTENRNSSDSSEAVLAHVKSHKKNEKNKIEKMEAKLRKYRRDPYNFFADSKKPLFNKIKYFYKDKEK